MIDLCLVSTRKGKTWTCVYFGQDFVRWDEAVKKSLADESIEELQFWQHLPVAMSRSPKAEVAAAKAAAADPQTKLDNEAAAKTLAEQAKKQAEDKLAIETKSLAAKISKSA